MTVVASIFRDAVEYVDRYFDQINMLEEAIREPVHLVIAEGDSTDTTHTALYNLCRPDDLLLKIDHGGRKFGSVDNPERWAQIAGVCNAVMDAIPSGHDVIYVEADLMWTPHTMQQLLVDLIEVPAVAPLCLQGERFYDTWGYRDLDGEKFLAYPPYCPTIGPGPLTEIGSAGSCVVMRADVAKIARFGDNDAIVGLGRDIRYRAGASLWLDQRVAVHHPEG